MLRAETILSTVETTITGLATTGSNVIRANVRTVKTHPALTLSQGGDSVDVESSSYPLLYRSLDVNVLAHVKNNTTPETQLNLIREEVYLALMADRTLGLNYVIDINPTGVDQPEITGDADQIVGIMQMNFTVRYTHSWEDEGN